MQFCPHCMKPAQGSVCGHCGGSMDWHAPATQLPLGTMLRGSNGAVYQLGAAKGQGGFGITYAAMDMMKGQRVAVKEYFPARCAVRGKDFRVYPMSGQQQNYLGGMRSFLEEAMMLSAVCALESVVSVREHFEANGTAYLVMEFVDGIPLHEVLRRRGPMRAAELMPKLPRLLSDLQTMHDARVIHRDISPDNIILMPDGKLKLIDFGSARSVQDGKSMTVMLKAGFSPVEQYQSKGQDAYTDVYALSATIYYCLTGVVPPAAVDRLTRDTLVPPNQAGAGLTATQEKALLEGMVVQPKLRTQSMRDLARKLLAAGPVPPPPPPPPPPVDKKLLYLGLGIAGALFLILMILLIVIVVTNL